MNSKRGQWASNLGFILAAAGSAVGLGNIWKFPGKIAAYGGGAFLLLYVLISVERATPANAPTSAVIMIFFFIISPHIPHVCLIFET